MNILQNTNQSMPVSDYFCTWSAQTRWALPPGTDLNAAQMRDRLNEDFLFGESGLLHSFDPEVRKGLIVVLDDGWDVPVGSAPSVDGTVFGSLMVDQEKFPHCTGTPAEGLCWLSQKVQSLGYAGLGLWVAVQISSLSGDVPLSDQEIFEYWAERARWCYQAGVLYWKCDWGNRDCAHMRRLMTRAVKQYAPNLLIEHLYPIRGVLDTELPRDLEDAEHMQYAEDNFRISDVQRTYDVALEFGNACTVHRLDRLASLPLPAPEKGCLGLLNVEDALYAAPGCGSAVGVMRVRLDHLGPRYLRSSQMTEVKRLLAWHKIAPPFCLSGLPFHRSEQRLTDTYIFPEDFHGWPDMKGQTISQSAPAALSFNLPLPHAQPDEQGAVPYLLACRHPQSGAAALSMLPRTLPGQLYYSPRSVVSLSGLSADAPVALFGQTGGAHLHFDRPLEGMRVFAQDLASDQAVDVTDRITLTDHSLFIPGQLIDALCAPNQPQGDVSSPAVVIRLA